MKTNPISNGMKILGIETSCDETALSIVECFGDLNDPKFTIIDSVLNSQASLHAPYGGVYPNLAKREHQKNLPILFSELFSKHYEKDINAIAVTQGPGLEPALWVGITFAKELGQKLNIPVIPVNHMEGHIVSVLLNKTEKFPISNLQFPNDSASPLTTINSPLTTINWPAIALLISGGHTQLVKVNSWGSYEIIGNTVDDAVGEAFDKVARILGLSYPGGPEISRLAEKARQKLTAISYKLEATFKLPRPMLHTKDFNFSFSGLKTAVLYLVKKLQVTSYNLQVTDKMQIATEFEDAVTEVLIKKTFRAIEETEAETLIIGGGVVSNIHIRRSFEKACGERNIILLLSDQSVSTDNAVMIAAAGYITFLARGQASGKEGWESDFKAEGNLKL